MIEFYGGGDVYSDTGVDLTLLRANLKRTPTERIQRNCEALPFLAALRESRRIGSKNAERLQRRPVVLSLEPLLRHLLDNNAEFVLVGGLAMIAQGAMYNTFDLDVCYSRTPKNLVAIARAMGPLRPRLRNAPDDPPIRFDPPTIQAGLNFTLTTDLGDIDFLGEIAGIGTYEQVFAQSEEREVLGLRLRVLSIEGLISAKKAAGRAKDKLHLNELEALKKERDAGH